MKCKGTRKDGNRCKREVPVLIGYCVWHVHQMTKEDKEEIKVQFGL